MIVVAGHLCLDVIPELPSGAALEPGALLEVGEADFTTGGAVANVGLALARLGLEVILLGRIGDDPFGDILRSRLERGVAGHPSATVAVSTVNGESTSYSVVISPPHRDRTFLHHPGCNATFTAADLTPERWAAADILHFGYPPLMRGVYQDGGATLAEAFARLRAAGVTVSLDLAMPDPGGASSRVDWQAFLEQVLPHVDLCLPSWDETCFMLRPCESRSAPSHEQLGRLAEQLLELGPALVALKLGEDGLYLRTAGVSRLRKAGRAAPPASWAQRELLSPNFEVAARGTTGAGDATIAGLLAALTRGLPITEAASMASAVGACSVEGVDAVGNVQGWRETRVRLEGWPRRPSRAAASGGWTMGPATGILLGVNDRGSNHRGGEA